MTSKSEPLAFVNCTTQKRRSAERDHQRGQEGNVEPEASSITLEFAMKLDDINPAFTGIQDWSCNGHRSQVMVSASEFMEHGVEEILTLSGRIAYFDELLAEPSGDGKMIDLASMINAVWDLATHRPRIPCPRNPPDRLVAIDWLFVDESHRGRHLGERAVNAVLRHFPSSIVTCIPANNEGEAELEAIRGYWRHLGYQAAETDSSIYWRLV